MVPAIIEFARAAENDFGLDVGRALEVGAYDVNGAVRPIFCSDFEYVGVDAQAGPGVDRVVDGHDIVKEFGECAFDLVLCCEMLEHDISPWLTLEQINRVLKPGGHLIVTTPTFEFPLHRYPKDYFRFGEDAYRELIFRDYELLRLSEVKDGHGYPILCGVGRKAS